MDIDVRCFCWGLATAALLSACAAGRPSLAPVEGFEVKITPHVGTLHISKAAVFESDGKLVLKGSVRRSAYSSDRIHVDVSVRDKDGGSVAKAHSGCLLQPARKGAAEMPFAIGLPALSAQETAITVTLHRGLHTET